jgi:cystinosin
MPSVWGFEKAPAQKPSRTMTGIFTGCLLGVFLVIFLVASQPADVDPRTSWAWLDAIYIISYVKVVVTIVKYAPQLLYNTRNQSTKGWHIDQILFDFAGGVLSVAQLGIDSYLQHDWSGVTGNPVKFLLGNVSVFYDVLFMFQHYYLYRNQSPVQDEERDPLLERGADDRRLNRSE